MVRTNSIALKLGFFFISFIANPNSLLAECELQPVDTDLKAGGQIKELSGIDESINFPGLFWVHNDGGSKPLIFGIDKVGTVVTQIELNAKNRDWEDLTTGSCGQYNCIYVADSGNNNKDRTTMDLYILREPETLSTKYKSKARKVSFKYPDGAAYDSEAIAYNESDKLLYLIRKSYEGQNTLYRFPIDLSTDMTLTNVTLEEVCNFDDIGKSQVTAADISKDGTRIIVRTYEQIREYQATAIDASICSSLNYAKTYKKGKSFEKQGEAIAYTDDDHGLISISEEAKQGIQKIHQYSCLQK